MIRGGFRRAGGALLLAAALALAGAPARADEVRLGRMTLGYTYYNRPGADLDQHKRDVTACAGVAGDVHSMQAIYNAAAAAPAYLNWSARGADRSLAAASLENCMVVRGWRVVRLPDLEGETLSRLPPAELSQRLQPWIGADQPHGEVVRVWNNDAAHGFADRYSGSPPRTRDGQLSLLAAAPELRKLPPPPRPEPPSPWINPRWPNKSLTPADLATVRPDAGVLLVRIKGLGFHAGRGVVFNREGSDKDTLPSVADHAPDLVAASKGLLFAHKEGDMFAFALPAGRWRLYGLGVMPTLNLCLGSPSFELRAGEVVYAGSFDLGADDIGPDLDMAPVRDWLAGQSRTVRAAAYVNGSQGPCGDNTIYALEFKGASFEPGYTWGGKAAGPAAAARAP